MRVPLFADFEVDAADAADAVAQAELVLKHPDAHAALRKLQWVHGEGAEHPISFELDERDLDEIEIQDAINLSDIPEAGPEWFARAQRKDPAS
jgi:hypothetical protein